MAWTEEQQNEARSEGWMLIDTVDGNRLGLRIYGSGRTNAEANSFVMQRARAGSRPHIEALKQIVHSSTIMKGKK